MKNFKGFTLIEILVVMTIIGVLASAILVSFSGQRERAKLTTAQQFDAQVSHALGAYAVGIWRFEEGAGIDIHDESGFGNDGTFSGNPAPVFPTGIYSGTTALEFDGTDDYVNCGNNVSLAIAENITIEAWIKRASSAGTSLGIVRKENVGAYVMLLSYNAGDNHRLGFVFSGVVYVVGGTTLIDDTEWHHVAISIKKTGAASSELKFFIDGSLDATKTAGTILQTGAANLEIGRRSGYFNGSIDDVRIYNHALSAMQIQQHFAMSAPAHGIAVNDK